METINSIEWMLACYADDVPENGGALCKIW